MKNWPKSEKIKNTPVTAESETKKPAIPAVSERNRLSLSSPSITAKEAESSSSALFKSMYMIGDTVMKSTAAAPAIPTAERIVPMLPVMAVSASFIAPPTIGMKLPTANFTPLSASESALFVMTL